MKETISIYNKNDLKRLNINKNWLNNLIKEGFLKNADDSIDVYYQQEIIQFLKVEKDLKEHFVTFSYFLQNVFMIKKGTLYQIIPYKFLQKLNQVKRIRCISYRNKLYVDKLDANFFRHQLYKKEKVMELLNINLYDYYNIIKTKGINEIKLLNRYSYIKLEDFKILKEISIDYKLCSPNQVFVKGTEIVKDRRYKHIAQTTDTLFRLCQKGFIDWFRDTNQVLYVNKSSVIKFSEYKSKLEDNYYTVLEVAKLLKIKTPRTILKNNFIPNLILLCEKQGIKVIELKTPFNFETIYISKKGLNIFLRTHISNRDLLKTSNLQPSTLNRIAKKHDLLYFEINRTLRFYPKTKIEKVIQFQELITSHEFYYSLKEVKELLKLNDSQMQRLRYEENLKFHESIRTTYYPKKDIDKIVNKLKITRENFVSPTLIKKTLGSHYFAKFKNRKKPLGIERFAFNEERLEYVYSIKEYREFYEQATRNKLISQISYQDPMEAFFSLIEIKKIEFTKHSLITKKIWFEYCSEQISNSNITQSRKKYFINKLVSCTYYVSDISKDTELFKKTTKEINIYFFNSVIPLTSQYILYKFLKELNHYLKKKQIDTKINLSAISSPYLKQKTKSFPKEIYSYDEFMCYFSYINKLDHKQNAINDGLNIIKKSTTNSSVEQTNHNCYAWLYSLLHLNNAWRHTDFVNIKMINIDFLGIKNLNDFRKRKLTNTEVEMITNSVLAKEYVVSKTKVSNNLFISDDIKHTFSTAYVICHLVNIECHPYSNNILHFGNSTDDFSKRIHDAFFKNLDQPLRFENRKMNRTLLTIMYSLMKKDKFSGGALEVAKRLRAHQSEESTNYYIQIPEEDINKLSLSLFQRGIFGYIPKFLSELIIGESLDITQTTKNIATVNKMFSNIYHIEATSGFINSMITRRQSVMELIKKDGTEKAFEYLNSLLRNLLPSKENNFQCLVAEKGCINPALDCKHCAYSVPNFYAISNIVESVSQRLKNFRNNFENTIYETEKIKQVNLLFLEISILEDAFDTFGQEVVLQFFIKSKDGYIELLELLDEVHTEKPLTKYLSNPISKED